MKKGFTLIELLIVIAILAVLSTVVVLVLNPAELLRQARDSTRISDLGSLNSAIALFLADVSNPSSEGWAAATKCTAGGSSFPGTGSCTVATSTAVTTAGWIGLNFNAISSGSPLSKLPIDPVNTTTTCAGTPTGCFYAYEASSTVGKYKLYANMESAKFAAGGGSDVESNNKDGGNVSDWYEIGSDMSL